jgi:sugar phosphate isomerase/epimerase
MSKDKHLTGEVCNKKNTPKISLFSKHLHWIGWEGMAQTAAEIGFDGLDLTVRPDGHVKPEQVEEDLPKVVEICHKAGVEVVMLATIIRDIAEPETEKTIKTATALGIKNYRMNWYHYDETKSIDNNLAEFKAKMKGLAAMNAHYKIKGAYQNHDGTWFGAPVWDLAQVLTEINSPWLGCQYDICNATIEGSKSWPLALELLSPFVHSIDIKDFIWQKSNGSWHVKYVPFGQGMVDFSTFFKQLNALNVEAPFSLHLEHDLGGAEKGMPHLTIPEEEVVAAISRDLKLLKAIYIPTT